MSLYSLGAVGRPQRVPVDCSLWPLDHCVVPMLFAQQKKNGHADVIRLVKVLEPEGLMMNPISPAPIFGFGR